MKGDFKDGFTAVINTGVLGVMAGMITVVLMGLTLVGAIISFCVWVTR